MLGVLCIVGCPVQLIREVFSRLHFRRRHTFASLWGAWLRFASLWRTNARGDSWVLGVHQSSVLLSCDNLPSFVAFCWVVIIFHRSSLKRAERLLKGCLLKLLSFKTAQYNILLCVKHGSSLSSENVCGSWRLHAVVPQSKSTEFCSSVAVVLQSKSTEFCSSVAVVPQSKSTEIWSSAAVVPQSKSTEIWSSAAPSHHDLWYLRHWNQQTKCWISCSVFWAVLKAPQTVFSSWKFH